MLFLDKFILGIWNVGIIEKDIHNVMSDKDIKIRWMRHSYRDRFFADPFLYNKDKEYYYILAEEFPFYKNIGFISLLTVDRKTMKLVKKETVIEEPFHLSYPFVNNGNIIPEAYRSDKVTSYTLQNNKVQKTDIVMDSGLIDQTFLEYNGFEWVFATDKDNPLSGLKIFYRKIGDSEWLSHAKNPVKSDITNSRPGGHFFILDNVLYRPVQDSEKLYGHKIRIMRVDTLTPDTFEETEVNEFSAKNNPPYNQGFHTFNVEDGFIVVDGYREYHSFFVKPLCIKLPKIAKMLGERK